MAKKKFRKKNDFQFDLIPEAEEKSLFAGAKPLSILKLIIGIALLPLVYAVSDSFLRNISRINYYSQVYFWAGVAALLAIHLFICELEEFYLKGQKIVEAIFSFLKPLVRVAPFVLPIYLILAALLYGITAYWNGSTGSKYAFIFIFGFTASLHLVYSAKALRSREGDFLKANYISGFSFIYILNLILFSYIFSLIFTRFSFIDFFNSSYRSAGDILFSSFSQLFINK